MALIQCHFYSDVLSLSTSMTVILPEQTVSQVGLHNQTTGDRHQTLYLLHGFSDDDTIWLRRTSIERYVASLGLAVVMPSVHHSFYADMEYGQRFWTFLTEELPQKARSFFPLSAAREDNFVAGLSMGGYGAFKWALRRPDQIAAGASLSGALDMAQHNKNHTDPLIKRTLRNIYGDRDITGTDEDLLRLLEQGDKNEVKPLLYQCCGTEDFLYDQNIRFRDACRQTNYKLTYEEEPGQHEWGYWDAKIQDVLRWLPLRKA